MDNLEDLFVQPMLDFYQSSGVSPVVKEWNSIRQAMVREVVKKLVPQLQEETSNRLLSEAREVVVESYGEELWKHASLPPVQVQLLCRADHKYDLSCISGPAGSPQMCLPGCEWRPLLYPAMSSGQHLQPQANGCSTADEAHLCLDKRPFGGAVLD